MSKAFDEKIQISEKLKKKAKAGERKRLEERTKIIHLIELIHLWRYLITEYKFLIAISTFLNNFMWV